MIKEKLKNLFKSAPKNKNEVKLSENNIQLDNDVDDFSKNKFSNFISKYFIKVKERVLSLGYRINNYFINSMFSFIFTVISLRLVYVLPQKTLWGSLSYLIFLFLYFIFLKLLINGNEKHKSYYALPSICFMITDLFVVSLYSLNDFVANYSESYLLNCIHDNLPEELFKFLLFIYSIIPSIYLLFTFIKAIRKK